MVRAGATLFKLSTLQFLYEITGSGLALGGLGFVMLLSMIPATLYGGVLADTVDRKKRKRFTVNAAPTLLWRACDALQR